MKILLRWDRGTLPKKNDWSDLNEKNMSYKIEM